MTTTSFSILGLDASLLTRLESMGYQVMTPVQQASLPFVLQGDDLIAQAETGSGKTVVFGIGLLTRLDATNFNAQALVLCPTRELADQVGKEIRRLASAIPNIKLLALCGGMSFRPQSASLEHGAHIIVGTPGRILKHLRKGSLKLDAITTLVLDEADRMLDMGFIHDIRRILKLLPGRRQNLMFSATYSNEIKTLSDGILHNPEMVEVARRNTAAEKVTQVVHPVAKSDKRALLSHLIREGNWSQVLVFARTKHGANRLSRQLESDGITSSAIHGNKSQNARTQALADFKSGRVRVLVATDVASRGLDISLLPHVVNFELPNVPEDYVHRIGRTGRAGEEGSAHSLVSADERGLLRDIEKVLTRAIPVKEIEGYKTNEADGAEDARVRPSRGSGGRGRSSSSSQRSNERRDATSTKAGGAGAANRRRPFRRRSQGRRAASGV